MYEDIHDRLKELNQITIPAKKDLEIESRLQFEFEKYRITKKQPFDKKPRKSWKQLSVIAAAVLILLVGRQYVFTGYKTPALPAKDPGQQNMNQDPNSSSMASALLEPVDPTVTGISTVPPEVGDALLTFLQKWAWIGRTHLQQVDIKEVSVQHTNGEWISDFLVNVKQRHLDTSTLPELQANLDAYKQNSAKWDEAKRSQERLTLLTLYNKLMSTDENVFSTGWGFRMTAKENDGKITPGTLHLFYDIGIHERQWIPVEQMLNQFQNNPNSEHGDRTHFDEVVNACRQIILNQ